ncbi:MAG: hypothetical protein ACK5AZ_05420 [Bryobacteraceae bacterium]
MIALDEDMVGSDNYTVIAQGLKVCLGLFCKLNNGVLLGAHFTPATSLGGMNLIMGHIRNNSGGNIAWLGMVAKFDRWAYAVSGLNSKEKLAAYFRTQLRYPGTMHYADLQMAPSSYDVRCTTGITPQLSWRATPNPNNFVNTPLATVLQLTHRDSQLSPTNGAHPGAIHNVPANTAGFCMIHDVIRTIT